MSNIFKNQSADEIVAYQSNVGRFLQNRICLHLPAQISKCIECRNLKTFKNIKEDYDENQCRFLNFRQMETKSENLVVARYPNPFEDASEIDLDLWKIGQHSFAHSGLGISAAKRILAFVGGEFCKVIQDEKKIFKRFNRLMEPIWKKPVQGIRESCDVCKTSIFNYHCTCLTCGLAICVHCFQYKKKNYKNPNPVWIKCTNNKKHQLNQLTFTQILPGDSLEYILTQMHKECIKHKIYLTCECNNPKSSLLQKEKNYKNLLKENHQKDLECKDESFFYHKDGVFRIPYILNGQLLITKRPMDEQIADNSTHRRLYDRNVLHLLDPDRGSNYKLFQKQWKCGQPVLVSGVDKGLDESLWHPESFLRDFGDHKIDLIDCNTNQVICDQPMSIFLDGFKNVSKRLRDKYGHSMMLKLKDWPQSEDFAILLPDRFKNLIDCLPLKDYTLRNGKFNLVSYLPTFFNPPDIGPKLYIAYGNAGTTHDLIGTTNLHLDMTDAVNIMVYVAITDNSNEKNYQWYMNEAFNVINESGCDESSINRIYENKLIPGAIWHIYHAKDANNIKELLIQLNNEKGYLPEECSDPIHDQSYYLHKSHRDRLFREYGVQGYAIIQCVGEAVFIPAGAPHQVRNLHNCIKVAGDFVTPENISQSFRMTQEFRNLSNNHPNHEDKLQLKNIVYHAVKDSLSVIMDTKKT